MIRSRLVAAVLRSFSGNVELEAAARRSLEEKLGETDPDDLLVEEAAERFDAAAARAPKFGRLLRLALLAGVLGVVFWPPAIKSERDMFLAEKLGRRLASSPFDLPGPLAPKERDRVVGFLFPSAEAEQKLLLSADSATSAEVLWRQHFPDDPAIYYHFVRQQMGENGKLPEDFLATAGRLDPDNAYAPLLAAAKLSRKAVRYCLAPPGDSSKPLIQKPLKTCAVKDEKAYRKALGLFALASEKTRLDDGRANFFARCLENQPPPGEDSTFMLRKLRCVWYFLYLSDSSDIIAYTGLEDLIITRAAELKAAGDKEGLAEFAEQWLDFVPKAASSKPFMINSLIWRYFIASTGRHLLAYCRELGLDEEAVRLKPMVVAACEMIDARRDASDQENAAVLLRAGILGFDEIPMLLNVIGNQLPVDAADLTADRLASYTLFEWLVAHGGVVVLVFGAGFCLLGWFRWGGLGRTLGKRMAEGLTPRDWAWILGLGILAPLAWHGVVTRIPAFHARDIFFHIPIEKKYLFSTTPVIVNVIEEHSPLNIIGILQCLSTLILLATATVRVASWRVAKRGRVFGFGRKRFASWFAWTGPLAAALALPACGIPAMVFAAGGAPEPRQLLPAAALLGYAVLWLLVVSGRAAFGLPSRGLERAITARVLVPAILMAAVALGVAGRLAAAEHRHWMARTPFGVLSPRYDGVTKYEHLATRWIQEQLLSPPFSP